MKTTVKLIILFLLFFGTTVVSAQSTLYDTYSDGGKAAFERGQIADSERLLKAALKEAENLNSQELIVDGSVNLGKVYQSQQKYEDAEKLYLKAIKIQEQVDGAESLTVSYALSNLGLLYAEQKKYDKAEEILRRALTIREKLLSANDTDIAVTLVNLGKLYSDQDKLIEAEVIYHKALQIFVYAGDDNPQGIIVAGDNLIRIYEKQKNYKELEKMLRFCIAIIENHNGKNDSNLLPYLDKYAIVLRKLKRNAQALKVEVRIKRIEKLK